jgi:hypothetical protein
MDLVLTGKEAPRAAKAGRKQSTRKKRERWVFMREGSFPNHLREATAAVSLLPLVHPESDDVADAEISP